MKSHDGRPGNKVAYATFLIACGAISPLFLPNHNLRPRPRLLLVLLNLISPRLLRETLAPLHLGEVREFILLLNLLLLLHLLIIIDLHAQKLEGVLGLGDRLDDVDVLGRHRLLKNRVEVPRHLAVACGMAAVATVLALGVEKVGTGSVARRITHVVLVEVRTAKVEAHLAERHLVAKKVDVLEKKLMLRRCKKYSYSIFFTSNKN